jgi:spermidine synthase
MLFSRANLKRHKEFHANDVRPETPRLLDSMRAMRARNSDIEGASPALSGALLAAFAAVGGAALVVQVLLTRELLTAWRGDEMSIGVALSVWLLTGGAGSLAFARLSRRARPGPTALSWGLIGLAAAAPLSLVLARLARALAGLTAGELAGFPALLGASVLSLAPYTVLSGALFPMGAAVLESRCGRRDNPAGRVYILEAAGALASGLAMSFLLLPRLAPLRIAFLATAALSAAALAVVVANRRRVRPGPGALATALALLLLAGVMTGPGTEDIDAALVGLSWRDLGFRSRSDSIYGRIVTARLDSQMTIYASGVLAASSPDRMSAEERVHLPMLEHPGPASVLLLGGGLGGALEEVLAHPGIERVDYVELDPELIAEAERAFGDAMTAGLDDPRVSLHTGDARFFVKRAAGSYDVVIVGAPDPTTAQLNRYYTTGFLEEVSRILAPDGLVALSVQSSENYVPEELAALLRCLRSTAESVFPSVTMLPGDPCHVFASPDGASFTRDAGVLERRVAERGIGPRYVRGYYLTDRLSPERLETFDTAVGGSAGRVNTDLSPACYYLTLVLRNRQFAGVPDLLTAASRFASPTAAAAVAAAILAVLCLLSARRGARRDPYRTGIVAAVLVVGASEMAMEVTAVVAFQSLYGYVYRELAVIVGAFMGGLALGGLAGVRAAARGASRNTFVALQFALSLVPLALAWAVAAISRLPAEALLRWASLFPLLVVGSAFLAGAQFPLATALLSAGRRRAGRTGGLLYGADLLGAAGGAALTAVLLLPNAGVVGTMQAVAILNGAVFAWLFLSRSRSGSAPA